METKTAEPVTAPVALNTSSPIVVAKAGEQIERLTPKALEWTAERVDLLRKQVCPPSASPEEFALFLDWCKATGLNPFVQQAYLVPRRVKVGEAWVEKHQPQAAIGGMRALVDLQPDHQGFRGGAVYAGDKFGVDQVTGEVVHQWDTESRLARGWKVIGAWGQALRRGRVTKIVFTPFESRVQTTREGRPTQFWDRDPSGMIAKCAEAAAYREAYPNAMSGVFLAEEWRDEAGHDVEALPAGTASGSKTEDLKSRVAANAAKAVEAQAKRVGLKPAAVPKAPESLPIEQVRFGKFKGKHLADLSTEELEGVLAEGDALRPKVTGQWLAPFNEGVEAVQNEIALRERGGETSAPGVAEPTKHANPRDGMTTAREPGSEG